MSNEFDELLQALLNETPGDVEPQSRSEEILLSAIDNYGVGSLPKPSSRLEAYLMALVGKMINASKNPDWDQNNPAAADYVRNRPFYREMGEKTLTVTAEKPDAIFDDFPAFEIGDTVTLKVDGVEQSMVAFAFNDVTAMIGDPFDILMSGTGEYGWTIGCFDGECAALVGTEDHTFSWIGETIPQKMDKKYLPSSIVYTQDGFVPMKYVLPKDSDVFGSKLTRGSEEYSTLSNVYINKKSLTDLTIERFSGMLDGSVFLPNLITVNGDMASVTIDSIENEINVSWYECNFYNLSGVGVAGAHLEACDAIIHEDADNPGNIICEYAIIKIADKRLT